MQINFQALEQALAPIAEIGQGELTFDAGPTTITIRVLLPAEEVEAQKYAASALNEADEGEHSAVDYLDRFRMGILSHAIIAVGDMDFRGVTFVETGKKLDNGTPIKIAKHKALRELLSRWNRTIQTAVFAKFSELSQRAEAEAERQIQYEPSSIPAEIDRLQKRVAELKEQMEQADAMEKTKFTDKVATLAATADAEVLPPLPRPPVKKPVDDDDEYQVDPEQVLPVSARRTGPISPASAPPPPDRTPQQTSPAASYQAPDSSFINMDDDEGLDAALDAEHRRIAMMRQRAAQGKAPVNEGSALQTIHPQLRRPPHIAAQEAEDEVGVLQASAEQARLLGDMPGQPGVPVYQMPVQDLGTPGARPQGDPRQALNSQPEAGGSSNPRFTRPNKP